MSITIEKGQKLCVKCNTPKAATRNFYHSTSKWHSESLAPYCKACLKEALDENDLSSIKNVLRQLDKPYIAELWTRAVDHEKETLGTYLSSLRVGSNKEKTYDDSEFRTEINKDDNNEPELESKEFPEQDEFEDNGVQNKEDVIRMLGYNPFQTDSPDDQPHLFNVLVDFLDEGTLEDSFKLPAVIEIVKSFNQLDKINSAISRIMSDVESFSQNVGSVNSLVGAKDKMLKSVLALAKDNGISVNHNNNKSKGAGTLSGIIKTLQEKGFEEASVNMFDIETAQGMKQVADLSNQSIMKQLQFDENDYTSMIMEQREMIEQADTKIITLEEENRLLKKEIMNKNIN